MSARIRSGARADVYTRITEEIIAAIVQGTGEWRAPWFHDGTSSASPTNLASGKRYRGINTLALWVSAMTFGYGDGLWGTYKQWQDAGAQVRKGERSTTVVLWKPTQSSDREDDAGEEVGGHRRMIARAFSVFNVAQVDGYARATVEALPEDQRLEHADAFIPAYSRKSVRLVACA
jgi:antirestriction protein ArdC